MVSIYLTLYNTSKVEFESSYIILHFHQESMKFPFLLALGIVSFCWNYSYSSGCVEVYHFGFNLYLSND